MTQSEQNAMWHVIQLAMLDKLIYMSIDHILSPLSGTLGYDLSNS